MRQRQRQSPKTPGPFRNVLACLEDLMLMCETVSEFLGL
jgi:hypothetical protein